MKQALYTKNTCHKTAPSDDKFHTSYGRRTNDGSPLVATCSRKAKLVYVSVCLQEHQYM